VSDFDDVLSLRQERDELADYVERLRDGIKFLLSFLPLADVPKGLDPTFYFTLDYEKDVKLTEKARRIDNLLDESQSTSLAEHDKRVRDEVIDECVSEGLEQLKHMSPTLAIEAIRALKEKT